MNKNTVLSAVIVGGVAVAAAAAIMVNSGYNPLQKYATVVAVQPAFDTIRTPRPVCGDEATLAQAQAQASSPADPQGMPQTAGVEAAATSPAPPPAAPATGDAQAAKPGEGPPPECVVVYDSKSVDAGFDVTYELDGSQKVVRMDRDPGRRIPVEGGELVLAPS